MRAAQGRVVLRDSIDLTLGTSADERRSLVLLDVTTAPLAEGAQRALRYHALVESLRAVVVPLAQRGALDRDRRALAGATSTPSCWREALDDVVAAVYDGRLAA